MEYLKKGVKPAAIILAVGCSVGVIKYVRKQMEKKRQSP
jgi:hypothetical protein